MITWESWRADCHGDRETTLASSLPARRRRGRILSGIILYFTYWFPSYHHARIVSGFLVGLPVAVAFGAPNRRRCSASMAFSVCGAGKSCTCRSDPDRG